MSTSIAAPHSWLTSDYGSYTLLNTMRDSIQQLQGLSPTGAQGPLDFFRAVQAVAQTGLTASTTYAVTFDTTSEVIDSASGHSTTVNNSRYIGQTAGWYEVSGVVGFAASGTGNRRIAQLALNGTVINGGTGTEGPQPASTHCVPTPVGMVQMNGTTDYVELFAFSDVASWATVATFSALNVRWVHS